MEDADISSLSDALTWKFGYGTDKEAYIKEAQKKFSLLDNGILDMPCTRLLLINVGGTQHSIIFNCGN